MTTCSTSRTDPDKLTSQVYPYIGGNEQQISDFPEELTIEYADVFSKSNANKLPAHSEFDFGIDLEPGFHPPHGKVYSLTPKETQVMATYVQEQLDKNFIRPSTSPAAAPCFFVAKKDGDLRPVQDYRGLNAGTIKKRYPLPLISDLLRDLSKGSVFTTLDLRSAYNLIRIKKGDEWKTAWICKQGLFEQQVMSFGFANAPPHFQWTTQPLTALLKKDIKFDWNQATEDSFKALKKAFKDNVILTHADESQEFLVEVDASDLQ
ncbi:hypothetical protein BASA84_000230 [Batrachochytrium salamandrivorans]|nr:hypothetical protein BASA84_000230 [Batrachochytrium salamandrivorans]